jgi:phosphoglycolate phosphatase
VQKPILILDYDGTIHETMHIYRPGIQEAVRWLREEKAQEIVLPSDERIQSWLGMNTKEMWQDFMPQLAENLKQEAGRKVGEVMSRMLQAGFARWYLQAAETLEHLKQQGYTMAVLSNCGEEYGRLHWKQFKMDRWMTAFFTSGTYNGISKAEILSIISNDFEKAFCTAPVGKDQLSKQDLENIKGNQYIMIGDRYSDLEAAKAIAAPMIGCLYGYGSREELQESTVLIRSITELGMAVQRCADGLKHPGNKKRTTR